MWPGTVRRSFASSDNSIYTQTCLETAVFVSLFVLYSFDGKFHVICGATGMFISEKRNCFRQPDLAIYPEHGSKLVILELVVWNIFYFFHIIIGNNHPN